MEPEPWSCTVVRAHGLHLMRPERSWRPIVTVEVDNLQQHETVLGCDGQNVNLKASFRLHGASFTSKVDVKVFHRSQSKKKGRRRSLVGSASCTLGEMWKAYGTDPKLRLQCQNPNNRSLASRGRPQNGALLHLRLKPPGSVSSRSSTLLDDEEEGYCSPSSSSDTSWNESQTLVPPPTVQSLRKRRRVRGYCVNSDVEPESYSESYSEDDDDDESKPLLGDSLFDDEDEHEIARPPVEISFNPIGWIAASLLPQYTEQIEVPPDPSFNFFERAISTFTIYSEMRRAQCDDEYERIFTRLQLEWTYTTGILVALAAVDTAVFSVSAGSIFAINRVAAGAVAASSVASGLGIVCATWLLVRYAWVDLHTFIDRAADVLSTDRPSYFFFALSARVPSLLMLVSALALLLFLTVVAWNAWPSAVVVGCFIVGVLMGLQWLVLCVLWVVRTVRRAVRFCIRLVGFGRETDGERREPAGAGSSEMSEKC
ncbi:hypothetical protein GGX14DRAFT_657594 [Mycena pura]|uniref:Transmembrane protein n=1 Tax=Mycena pura TaxID=153505 RepID=A0AAD6YLL8_9AGAR|nr:hypothetical protein GGX14DRAFT_657594 [Mycena pura]